MDASRSCVPLATPGHPAPAVPHDISKPPKLDRASTFCIGDLKPSSTLLAHSQNAVISFALCDGTSAPDFLPPTAIRRCGSDPTAERTIHVPCHDNQEDVNDKCLQEADHSGAQIDTVCATRSPACITAAPANSSMQDQSHQGSAVSAAAALVVLCGCLCQAPYEVMNSRDKGCGALISLAEYTFGLIVSIDAIREPRKLPFSLHIGLAMTNVFYSLLCNMALNTSLPTAVLITMKNGNLVSSVFLGVCVLKKQYSALQYLAVMCITAGLIMTGFSGQQSGQHVHLGWSQALGILYLAGALLSRALGGVIQELYCRKHGVPVSELLFFRSLLGTPIILTQLPIIHMHTKRWIWEEAVGGVKWPGMWALLLLNLVFDYGTKVSMTRLINRTSALTATLALTCQRFVSFIMSALVLSLDHLGLDAWCGAALVLLGTMTYSLVPAASPGASKKKTA